MREQVGNTTSTNRLPYTRQASSEQVAWSVAYEWLPKRGIYFTTAVDVSVSNSLAY